MSYPIQGTLPVQPQQDDRDAPRPGFVALRFDPLRFTKRVVTAAEMQRLIAEAAYFRSANRDFAPGYEVEDWLAAEREVADRVVVENPLPGA
jgi:hypothetical protein